MIIDPQGSSWRACAAAALALAVTACERPRTAQDIALERGLCLSQQRYLSDAEFVEIVLRERAAEAWEGRYESPAAFVADTDGCCDVARYPTEEDWNRGYDESDIEDRTGRALDQLGPSRYLVGVRVRYPAPNKSDTFILVGASLGACGDIVSRGYEYEQTFDDPTGTTVGAPP